MTRLFALLFCFPSLAAAGEPLRLVATTAMIADALQEVGGARVEVQALMGAGVDPHGYRQTRSDIVAMTRADAIFRHGLHLEAQLERFFDDLQTIKPLYALAEDLPPERLHVLAEGAGRFDPHVWMDPELWAEVVLNAQSALIALDPEGEAEFRTNAQAYLRDLAALDAYSAQVLASVPQKVLVTAHDAFGYFGAAYGFEVQGIQGLSTESEAGLARIEDLVRQLVAEDVQAIFIESSVSDRNIKALIEGAAAQGHEISIGGEVFSDAMGTPGTYEGTYLGMIDHNITTMARALGGQAPSGGRIGKLTP